MAKYPKITQVLGLVAIDLHSNLFGNKQPFAKFTEEDLAKIENALNEIPNVEEKTKELKEQVEQLTEINKAHQEQGELIAEAVKNAIETAGLEQQESLAENIVLLGAKCKEYGESNERHSIVNNNGSEEPIDGLINGYFDPNDEHNKFLKNLI